MDLAIMIEGQDGLTWERWKRLATAAEDFGFAGLYRSDHYTNSQPPDKDSLELWISLTYLASHTKRIEFGPLVSPLSFRHPTILARMASGIDDLSGGRLQLGLGAGWQHREHHNFGRELLSVSGRMQRFEEGLDVISLLLKNDEPVRYTGSFYQLHDAVMLPRPQRPGGPPIVVGGNGRNRILNLAARYADEWNGTAQPPEEYRELNQLLDGYLQQQGRQPSSVRRSLMTRIALNDKDLLREPGRIGGSPSQIVDQLGQFAESGCQRVMAQWLDQDDIAGLETIAAKVIPQLQ